MKKITFLEGVLLLVLPLFCFSLHAQDILWEKTIGGKHADYLFDLRPTPDYGFLLAGSSLSRKTGSKTDDNSGDLDYWLWKMDEEGKPVWQKSYGGSGSDLLQSVQLTSDGGYILGGTSESQKGFHKKDSSRGKSDYWILKLDAHGVEQWQKTLGGAGLDQLKTVIQTSDGGYLVAGSSSSDNSGDKTEKSRGNLDYWLVRLDSKGNIKWQRTLGGKYADILKSVIQTKDGGYLVGGTSNSPESGDKTEPNYGLGDYWVLKLDAEGRIEWQRTYGGDQDDQLKVVHQTPEGDYLLGGNSNSGTTNTKTKTNKSGTDIWLLKIAPNGTPLWQETYSFGKVDFLASLHEETDGTLLLGAYSKSNPYSKKQNNENSGNYIAMKLTDKGEEVWTKTIGSRGEDILTELAMTRDGGYLMAGTSKGKPSGDKNSSVGSQDFWVVKLRDKDKKVKERIVVEAVPNPTKESTNIIVGFDYDYGTCSVYDLGGRQLQSFDIKKERTIPVTISNLPEGIYLVEIKTNTKSGSVKVMKN